MSYHFLEHTADVKFQAFGDSLEEAFSDSFNALNEIISGKIAVRENIVKNIEVDGDDLSNLLYKFLEEFLFLLDSEDFLASKIKKIEIDSKKNKLTCSVTGDNAEHYNFTNDVKAITYNDMFVKEEDGKWICQVVLDV